MRRVTALVLITGGTMAAIAAGACARRRLGGGGPEAPLPDEDAIFTVFAPGGKYGYWANGPLGWVMARLNSILEAGVHQAVAEMLDLQPEDELLDIGCGPGRFLATKAQHVRRVVGLDLSRVMLRQAERRLAARLAAGTARLVEGNAAELPFEDGEFSAVTAILAPIKPAEAFRVLRPGGRVVFADPYPRRMPGDPAVSWGFRRRSEADYRRIAADAGFTDITARYDGQYLLVSARKPADSVPVRPAEETAPAQAVAVE